MAFRRLVGFLGVLSIGLLPLAAQPLPAAASTGGTLFALGPTIVAKADPSTGVLTTFANLPLTPPTQPFPSFHGLTSDPNGHRLFLVRTTYSDFMFTTISFQLITVDTQTAAVSISHDMAQGVGNLVFDPSSGSLFGQNNACCPFQLLRIDPATGAQTHFADLPGVQDFGMAVAPAKRSLYMASMSFVLGQPQPVITMLTVDTSTGVISQSPQMSRGIVFLVYDTSSGTLFGKTFCCPASLVRVDPGSGVEAVIGPDLNLGSGFTIDSATHTIFMTDDEFGASGFNQFILSVNDQTGASSLSTGSLPANTFVGSLAFEGVAITPDSIKADVRSALDAGAITNAGVADSLLAELNQAQAARARGQCGTAADLYEAFINEVNAQTGKAIASATASHLVSEAQFLIANCP